MIIYWNSEVHDYYDYEYDGTCDDTIRQFSIVNEDVMGILKEEKISGGYEDINKYYNYETGEFNIPKEGFHKFAAIETIIHVNDKLVTIYPAYIIIDHGEIETKHTMFNMGDIFEFYYG